MSRLCSLKGGHPMKERVATDSPNETSGAQISRRQGLKFSAASIMASLPLAYRTAAAQAQSSSSQAPQEDAMPDNTAIRPFQVSFPESEVTELRRRIVATRWPERELASDAASRSIWATTSAGDTQGVQLATMQKLMQYWGTEYN